MKISDKDLDNLLRRKLNDNSEMPDDFVWDNITAKLDNQPKKRHFLPYLNIAATLLLLLSVGVWLLNGKEQIIHHSTKTTKIHKQAKQLPGKEKASALKSPGLLVLSAKINPQKQKSNKINLTNKVIVLPVKREVANDDDLLASAKSDHNNNGFLQQNEVLDLQLLPLSALVPVASVSLKTDELQDINFKKQNNNAVFTNNFIAKKAHKRIRNMGDLVNLVIGKVDKRSDKIIEFTDRDGGDEAELSGVNLGFISLKKEK